MTSRQHDRNRRRRRADRPRTYDGVRDEIIFARDGWTCQMPVCTCPAGRAIDPDLPRSHKWAASIDHIVPLGDGGADDASNKRAAHARCNFKALARLQRERRLAAPGDGRMAGMSKPYRILVTGSRDWDDENRIAGELLLEASRRPASQPITVIQGGARGADEMAARVAMHYEWQVESHPADWERHGKAAGPRRNQEMIDLGADVVLAFIRNGSRGASHCAAAAEKAGLRVVRITA